VKESDDNASYGRPGWCVARPYESLRDRAVVRSLRGGGVRAAGVGPVRSTRAFGRILRVQSVHSLDSNESRSN
jgi:hypothetical protein